LRSAHDLKVRQPLKKLHVACRNPELLSCMSDLKDIILEELNVKEAEFRLSEADFATVRTKANFARLGPKLGPLMRKAAGVVAALTGEQVESLARGEPLAVMVDGTPVDLTLEDVLIEYLPREGSVVAAEGGIVVALDTALTPELVAEGLAREFVSKLQNMRKTADLEVTQRIRVQFAGPAELRQAVGAHLEYITSETLSLSCEAVEIPPAGGTDWDLNGHPCVIKFEAVAQK
jgi:isoleucyl-tRNA synthetase